MKKNVRLLVSTEWSGDGGDGRRAGHVRHQQADAQQTNLALFTRLVNFFFMILCYH